MKLGDRGAWLLGMVLLLAACRKPETPAAPPDPAVAKRGRTLFQRGQSARGEPLAGFLGPERVELSGDVAACARCHGPSGRGSREGGVEVPDISPASLGRPRNKPVEDVEDRSRPAYTRETLLGAVTEGVSASGRPLGVAMPRYALGDVEREELLAYLQTLGEAPDPGVTADTLTFGAALPLSGRLGPVGQDVAAVLRAVFADVNAKGGIFRRKLELVVEDDAALYETAPAPGPDATARLLERGVLAMVGSMRKGALASDALLQREGAPLVLPLALGSGQGDEASPIFFLYPDEPALARLVVQHLSHPEEHPLRRQPLAVVHADDAAGRAWAEAVRQETSRRELAAPVVVPLVNGTLPPEALKRLASASPHALLYSGPSEGLAALLRAPEARKVPVFAPASLADPSAVADAPERVLFVYPGGLGDRAPRMDGFSTFMQRHGLEPRHPAFQLGAYAAARVLVEALSRMGADVARADLQLRLEALRDFETGVSPPVSFGLQRRTGVQGAQLARLDAKTGQFVPASEWIPLSP